MCADKDATGVVVALLAWRAMGLVGPSGLGTAVGLVRGLVSAVRREHRLHLVELDAWTWWALGHPAEAETMWSRIVGAVARVERDGFAFVELAEALDTTEPDIIALSQVFSEFRGMPFDSTPPPEPAMRHAFIARSGASPLEEVPSDDATADTDRPSVWCGCEVCGLGPVRPGCAHEVTKSHRLCWLAAPRGEK